MARPCIVVAGMGRCGTSLTMQMLHAAGVPCVGPFPAFETDASGIDTFDPASFAAMTGQAIKLIDPANLPVGDMPNHIVLWLDRDPKQQARSQAKMLSLMGLRLNRGEVRAIEADLRASRSNHRARVGLPGGCPGLTIRFESLLSDSAKALGEIAAFLADHGWHVSVEAMSACIIPRSSGCYPGFLELSLMGEAA